MHSTQSLKPVHRPSMTRTSCSYLVLCVWLFGLIGRANSQSTNSMPDFSDIEAFLQQSKLERQQVITNQVKSLLAQLNPLATAKDTALLEAYKTAYENINFEGAEHNRIKETAWENDHKALFKDNNFIWALRAHVQYLIATLQKILGKDETAILLTSQWIDNFPDTDEKFAAVAKFSLLKGGISESVFLKAAIRPGTPGTRSGTPITPGSFKHAYALTDFLRGLANWYQDDLTNLPEIHRVNIIGYYRTRHDPLIFQEWQKNISLEQATAQRSGLTAQKDAFTQNRRAWLLWQMGKDYALFNQPRKAVDVMVLAIKESPRCSDYDAIVEEIVKVITETREAAAAKTNAPEAVVSAHAAP